MNIVIGLSCTFTSWNKYYNNLEQESTFRIRIAYSKSKQSLRRRNMVFAMKERRCLAGLSADCKVWFNTQSVLCEQQVFHKLIITLLFQRGNMYISQLLRTPPIIWVNPSEQSCRRGVICPCVLEDYDNTRSEPYRAELLVHLNRSSRPSRRASAAKSLLRLYSFLRIQFPCKTAVLESETVLIEGHQNLENRQVLQVTHNLKYSSITKQRNKKNICAVWGMHQHVE